MLTADATVETNDPARYLAQFCKHAAAMGEHAPAILRRHALGASAHASGGALVRGEVQLAVECSDTNGVVRFTPWGQCTITVDGDRLLLRADADDADGLRRIQDVISGDLERWGKRENLQVAWRGPDQLSPQSAALSSADNPFPQANRAQTTGASAGHHRLKLAAAGGLGIALIVIVHLTVAGAATVVPLWLGWTAAGVLLIPAIVVVLHAAAPLTIFGVVRHTHRRAPPLHPSVRAATTTEAGADDSTG
jgi:hypothetical protein